MEEVFFFLYHFGQDKQKCLAYPVHERKWLIKRFITQKNKEVEEMKKK